MVDSHIRSDGNAGNVGTESDFESDLGLTERATPFDAWLSYHGWDRSTVGLKWFDLSRNASGSWERNITWGDTVIPVGAQSEAFFAVNIVRFFASYELSRTEKLNSGLGLGVHGAGLEAGIDSRLIFAGGAGFQFESEADTGAVLPQRISDFERTMSFPIA